MAWGFSLAATDWFCIQAMTCNLWGHSKIFLFNHCSRKSEGQWGRLQRTHYDFIPTQLICVAPYRAHLSIHCSLRAIALHSYLSYIVLASLSGCTSQLLVTVGVMVKPSLLFPLMPAIEAHSLDHVTGSWGRRQLFQKWTQTKKDRWLHLEEVLFTTFQNWDML